jgi:predicted nucleic acid-binding protein
MRKLKIYIDTSVIGGYYDTEFSQDTKSLFKKIIKGDYQLVLSDLTEKELLNAPENVKTLLKDLQILNFEIVAVTSESINLATEYINEKVVGQTSYDDCIHIATATINRVDLLVSWNFKHIVNIQRIRGYNSINIKNGYQPIEIRSPKDLIDYED